MQQSMGDNEPESQSLSKQVGETAQWQGSWQHLVRKSRSHRWERVWSESSGLEPLAADAKGDQCGMEQHAGVRSSALSAVVWSLPQWHLDSGGLHRLGLFINVLTPLMESGESPQKPIHGWSCPADTSVLITCAGILGVSLCHTCLL